MYIYRYRYICTCIYVSMNVCVLRRPVKSYIHCFLFAKFHISKVVAPNKFCHLSCFILWDTVVLFLILKFRLIGIPLI